MLFILCAHYWKQNQPTKQTKKKRNSFDKNVCEIYCYLHALESDKDFN